MKQVTIRIMILCTLILLSMSCSKKDAQTDLRVPLSVKAVLAAPKRYQNKSITIVGNIYKIQKEKSKFHLVDLTECTSSCNPVSCKVMTLPVNYGDVPIPSAGTNVLVSGEITRKKGKFSFTATKVEPYNEE